ncbi:hypothetical protein ACIQYL_20775 [Lysinibacillus xylanilyticus]|uniref:hypothetical protein n=1 Tax=Lysinibacillus xylanilyticus TaxID=582475 RepID=UPI0037FF07B3
MEHFADENTYKGMSKENIIQILIMRNLNSKISVEYFDKLSFEQLIREFERE